MNRGRERKRETTAVLAVLRVSAGPVHAHASARDGGWGGWGGWGLWRGQRNGGLLPLPPSQILAAHLVTFRGIFRELSTCSRAGVQGVAAPLHLLLRGSITSPAGGVMEGCC